MCFDMANKKNLKISKVSDKKREKEDQLKSLFQPKGNIAFLDAEFNAGMIYATGRRINEIISIGLVICDERFQKLEQYYSLVRPKSGVPIFPVIKEMTGITNEMLLEEPDFIYVSNKITDLLNRYQVHKIYTWGAADKHSLRMEKEKIQLQKAAKNTSDWKYIDMCTDISGVISAQMLGVRGGLAINMENLMFLCEIDRVHEHNALSDAIDLFQCICRLRENFPVENCCREFQKKRELVNQYYQEKSLYNSFRRFKSTSKGSDLYAKWGDRNLLKDVRMRALEDDIKYLKGEIPYDTEFQTIQEYFSDNK